MTQPSTAMAGGPLTEAVNSFLANRANFGSYDLGRYVNRAIQNEGAELMSNRRRMSELVTYWEQEASAPTGMHPDAQDQADELRSEMDGDYEGGRLDIASAVQSARKSRKVLLEPDTCKLVVDLDYDGAMSRYMDLDVKEVFGLNPDYDPQAAIRLQEMAVNAEVDFSRNVDQGQRQKGTRLPMLAPQQQRQGQSAPSKEPTPLRKALLEEIANLRERQGFQPGEDPYQLD